MPIIPRTGAQITGILEEVEQARGQRSALGLRIACISNFASPNAGGVIAGQFYDNAFQGTASSTLAMAAGRIDLAPYYTSQPLTIDQIGVAVTTANAGAARCVIYTAGDNGWPDALALSVDIQDTGSTGYRSGSVNFTFDSGRQYWLGVHTAGTPTIRAINVSSAVNLGVNGSAGNHYFTVLRRVVTYANGAPELWEFAASNRTANIAPPSIRMRSA